jgi:hypothetical protein
MTKINERLSPKNLVIDPPEGWRYGFPKVIPEEHQTRTLAWLVEQGYPQKLIDELGNHFYCRYFNIGEDQ